MIKKFFTKYKNMPVPVRAAFWYLVCSFMHKGVSIITIPIFARLLSTEQYGQYTVFDSWLKILTVFVTLKLGTSVFMQGMVKFEDKRKEYASAMQGLSFTLVVVWTGIYLIFHDFFNRLLSLTTVQVLAMMIMMWASAAFSFWSTEKRVDYQYRNMVVVTILMTIAKPAVGIVFVLLAEDKVTARILGLALVELIGYTGLFLVQMKRGKRFYSKEFWKHALAYNIPLIPHYLSQTVLNGADKIMIEDMVSKSAAGIYGLAYSISQGMMLFNNVLGQTLNPWEYRKIKAGTAKEISNITYPTLILIAGANLVLIAFAPEFVRIFAPASYYNAIWVIPPIAMSGYFIYLYERVAKVAFYFEKTKIIALTTTLSAVLNVGLNYIFIPVYGYYAAGYTTLVCYIAFAVFHYILMRKMCRTYMDGQYLYETKTLLMITGVFMAVTFVYLLSYGNIVLRYSLTAVLLAVVIWKRKELLRSVTQVLALKKK